MAWMDRGNRRALLGFTAVMMVLSLSITRGLYPALGYTKGGRQEALSVPFQQTARYLRDYPEEVTEEERAAIDGVLEYDRVAERYVPSGSASVKILFRQDATNADLLNYFRTWARMLLKHPGTYFQATYANYDQYLYPGEVRIGHHDYGWSAWMMEFTNDQIEPLGKRFSYPVWNERFRFIADSLVDAGLYQVPPFSLLMMPATYCWGLIILFFWTFSRRRGSGRRVLLMLMAASCVQFLVMFVGPLNGYNSRYLLTLTAVLPALALMLLAERGKEEYHRAQIERRRGREA